MLFKLAMNKDFVNVKRNSYHGRTNHWDAFSVLFFWGNGNFPSFFFHVLIQTNLLFGLSRQITSVIALRTACLSINLCRAHVLLLIPGAFILVSPLKMKERMSLSL